jgi:soluble lytic murein transglycosylase-like protein
MIKRRGFFMKNLISYRMIAFILFFAFILLSFPCESSAQNLDPAAQAYINAYRAKIYEYNPKLTAKELDAIVMSIMYYCRIYRVEPRLVVAVVACESCFNINATSYAGAQGLGQLMPDTARGWGISDSYNPVQNIHGTVQILRNNLEYFSGKDVETQIKLALAGYNAGMGAVQRYGGVPPYSETQNYVVKVYELYKELCGVK